MARNKHPEQTVQLILETAARLFAQKGYDETSMQDIMDATHLSKGAIYHHFSSKLDILLRIADQIVTVNSDMLGEIRDRKGVTGAEKLRELFRAAVLQDYQQKLLGMMPCLLDNPQFLAMLIRSILHDAAPHYVQPILEEGMTDGSIQTDSPRELSQVLLLLTDLWVAPILEPAGPEEVRSRCRLFNQLTRPFGVALLDEELVQQLESYWRSESENRS